MYSPVRQQFVVCLSSYTRRRRKLSKALVYYCFLVFPRVGEYISLDMFYCLSSYTRRRQFLSKALVCYCSLVFCRTGEYISLDLFYFFSLTSSCSLIPRRSCSYCCCCCCCCCFPVLYLCISCNRFTVDFVGCVLPFCFHHPQLRDSLIHSRVRFRSRICFPA